MAFELKDPKVPDDRLTDNQENPCSSLYGMYFCTREVGHTDDQGQPDQHVAGQVDPEDGVPYALATWDADEGTFL